ncbi:unnamed protein product [Pylaiella littoralis]
MAASDNQDLRQIRRLANQALVDIFRSLGGNRWRNNSGWLNPGTDLKTWHGVTLIEGSLVSLNLINNDLEGIIPRTISNLATLAQLNLSYNVGLVGVLPREVGSMASLTVLHLYCAGIHGPIPESLSLLQGLEELWLNGNRLSGFIPEGLGRLPHLRELYLNANELIGGIPSSLGELASLEGLNLGWNQLSGSVPASLRNLASLRLLVLEGNELLEETPPAEQGTGLLKWFADKRVMADLPGQDLFHEPEPACQAQDLEMYRRTETSKQQLHFPRSPCKGRTGQEHEVVATYLQSGSSPALQEVLRDGTEPPFNLGALKAFAAAQLMEENIEFWVEVEKFKVVDEDGFQQAAADVCSRFISPGAPKEINLSGDVKSSTMASMRSLHNQETAPSRTRRLGHQSRRNCLREIIEGDADLSDEQRTINRTIFDQAQRQVFDLIEADAFPRFIQFINRGMQEFVDDTTTQAPS